MRVRSPGLARLASPALVAIVALAVSASVAHTAPPALQISPVFVDPTTDPVAQHNTALVEVDSHAYGSTVVGVFQVGRFNGGGSSAAAGFATSTDGGATWTTGILPSLTTATSPPGPYPRVVDENVAYDALHDVWLIGANPVDLVGSVYQEIRAVVSRSTDGGLTWSVPVTVAATNYPDKQWTVCDNGASSPFRGTCYVAFSADNLNLRIQVSRSTDGGLTWSAPVNSGIARGYNVQPIVQPDGTLVVVSTGATANDILAVRSTDRGVSFSPKVTVADITRTGVPGLRVFFKPTVDIDVARRIWVAWADCRFRTGCATNDIVTSNSTDGVAWSSVARVTTDPVTSSIDHVIPALGIDPSSPGGAPRVGIEYIDIPVNPCGGTGQPACQVRSMYVSSSDGGTTWSGPASSSVPACPSPTFRSRHPARACPATTSRWCSSTELPSFSSRSPPRPRGRRTTWIVAALVPDTIAPVNNVLPIVSGTAWQGETLTVAEAAGAETRRQP